MDLFFAILRFLFGVPVEGSEVEPIVVHRDGRTSSGRLWLSPQGDTQNTNEASTLLQFFEHLQAHSVRVLRRWSRLWTSDRPPVDRLKDTATKDTATKDTARSVRN